MSICALHDRRPHAPVYISSEIYRGSSYGSRHPLSIPRVPTVTDLSRALGWLPREQFRTSPTAKPAALCAFHTPEYVQALRMAEISGTVNDEIRARHHIGTLSNPVFPEVFRRPATAAGGSLLATDLLTHGGIAYNPGGGTHHGLPNRANGFCYLNDPVLAILALIAQGLNRVAYVDIDAHHCDGVVAAFADDPRVMMISTHEEGRWPFSGTLDDQTAVNLPLPAGSNDTDFHFALEELILPAIAGFRPDALVLQCGADAVAEDPLSRLEWSNNSHWRAVAALKGMAPRFLVLGGGGYNPWTVARLWAGVWATLNSHEIPRRLPEKARSVLSALHWSRLRGDLPEHLVTTLRDTPRNGPLTGDVRDRVRHLRTRLAPWH